MQQQFHRFKCENEQSSSTISVRIGSSDSVTPRSDESWVRTDDNLSLRLVKTGGNSLAQYKSSLLISQ